MEGLHVVPRWPFIRDYHSGTLTHSLCKLCEHYIGSASTANSLEILERAHAVHCKRLHAVMARQAAIEEERKRQLELPLAA